MKPTLQSAPHICKRESIPLSLVKINIPTGSTRDKGYGISDYNSGHLFGHEVNKFTLIRQFSRYYLDTPLQYLNKVRIDKAKELLLYTHEKIGAIGQTVGIDNTNHFIRLFKEKTGVSPSVYRRETPVL